MPNKKINTKGHSGIVEWFDPLKGVGYIKTDEGNFVAVNYKDLPIKDGQFVLLRKNQKVLFDIYMGEMGAQAKNINIVN